MISSEKTTNREKHKIHHPQNRPVKPIVTPSEIQEYVFCPRAWWFRYRGIKPGEKLQNLAKDGIKHHEALGKLYERSQKCRDVNQLFKLIFIILIILFVFMILR